MNKVNNLHKVFTLRKYCDIIWVGGILWKEKIKKSIQKKILQKK